MADEIYSGGKRKVRRIQIERSFAYRSIKVIAKYMDKYFLDPIIGILPGAGDILPTVLLIPFLYVSLFQLRSLPLTLAVVFNMLRDVALGMIPFWIGNFIDVFNRSYLQNFRLIVGFVEGDKEIIRQVNRNALGMGVLIVICCLVICGLVKLGAFIASAIGGWFGSLLS